MNQIAGAVGGLEGKCVLEVGPEANGNLLRLADIDHGAAQAVGVNPAFPAKQIGPRSRLEQVDARATGFADNSIDVVYSVSAFEHVQGLDQVLAECHRVLRPGGFLYAHFGPVWSSPYGHHLWVIDDDRILTYHDVVLPSWCHLLRTREELQTLCERDYSPRTAKRIVEFILDSPEQNQLFFDDYLRLAAESEFCVLFIKGFDVPSMAIRYADTRDPQVLEELSARYPGRDGFLYDGVELLLHKRDAPGHVSGGQPVRAGRRPT